MKQLTRKLMALHALGMRTAMMLTGAHKEPSLLCVRRAVMLAVVMISMFAIGIEARADGFSWDAGMKTLTVTGADIANNLEWPLTIGGTSVEKTDVEHLVIGSGVTSIGNFAFKGCTNLKTASLSNDVRSLGSSVFYDCTSLTTINFPQNDDFTHIPNDAFSGCKSLTTITLPKNVATIGDRSFYGCSGLTSADLGLVEAIGSWAFHSCSSLPTISLPATLYLQNIGDNAFASCTSLKTVRTYYFDQNNFGNRVFSQSMKGVIIPYNLTNITKAEVIATFPSIKSEGNVFYEGTKSKCEQVFNEEFNLTNDKSSRGNNRNKTSFNFGTSYIHWLCTATFDTQGMATNPAPVTNVWAGWDSIRWVQPPVVEGYDFGGWYWDEACTEIFGIRKDEDGIMILPNDTITHAKDTIFADVIPGDVTLYAKWIPKYYFEVTFDSRGKGKNPSSQDVSLNKTATEPAKQFYRDQDDGKLYEIEGWYTDAGCTQRYDFSTPIDHSFTLYAKWSPTTTTQAHVTITTTGDAGGDVWLTDAMGRIVESGMVPAGIYTLNIRTKEPTSYIGQYSSHGSIIYIPRPSQEDQSSGESQSGQSGESHAGGSPAIDTGDAGEVTPEETNPTIIDIAPQAGGPRTIQIDLTSQDADITVNFVSLLVDYEFPVSPVEGGYLRCVTEARGYGIIDLTATAKKGYVFRGIIKKELRNGALSEISIRYGATSGPQTMTYTSPYRNDAQKVTYEAIFEKSDVAPYITKQPLGVDLPQGYAGGRVLTVEAASESDNVQLSYQWYQHTKNSYRYGGTAIEGATEPSYAIPAGLPAGTTYYYCVVTASGIDARSDIVAVTVGVAATRGATASVTAASYPYADATASAGLTSVTRRATVTRAPTALSGKCGHLLTWTVSKSAGSDAYDVLTISGRGGVMRLLNQDEYPWHGYGGTIRSIVVEDGVTNIGSDAFRDFSGVTSLVLGKDVKTIGTRAFEGLTSLTSVALGDQVKHIGSSAFQGCTSLSSLTLGAGVETIWASAFEGLTSLESVALGDQVKTLGPRAFHGCSSLTSITVGAGLTTIGKNAFNGCTSLSKMTVREGNGTFDSRDNCNAIIESSTNKLIYGCKNTVIPETVTTIGDFAFAECSTMTSIDIPDAVTTIGEYAFYNCSSLTSVTIPANMRLINWDAFKGCTGVTDVYCYANPYNLTWHDVGHNDFIGEDNTYWRTTKCHVLAKAPFESAWRLGNLCDVNVTFVGDLAPSGQPVSGSYQLSGDYVVFYDTQLNPITEAAAGETVIVGPDPNKFPQGKYFIHQYTATDGVTVTVEENGDGTFTMPAKNVSVSAVLADQEEYALNLITTEPQDIPKSVWLLSYSLMDYNVVDDETGDRFLDLNLDGKRDVLLEKNYDETTEVTTYRAIRQPGADDITENLRFDVSYIEPLQYNSLLLLFKPQAIQSDWITVGDGTPLVYNGQAQTPAVVVRYGATTLSAETDYEVTYSNNMNACEATAENAPTVTVTAKATSTSYKGSATKTFTINKKPITVTAENLSMAFDGTEPVLTYTIEGLVEGDNVTIELQRTEGNDAGTYDITLKSISGDDNYSVTFVKGTFTIKKEANISVKNPENLAKDGTIEVDLGETEYAPSEKKLAYSFTPVSGVTVDAVIKIALESTSGNKAIYKVTENRAEKLTFGDVEWKESGALLTRPKNLTFSGAAVETSKIHFTNALTISANSEMTLVKDFGDAVGTITGSKYRVGTAFEGEGSVSLKGSNLIFTTKTGVKQGQEQTHNTVMAAGSSPATITFNGCQIGISSEGLALASNAGADGVATFASIGGSANRTETGCRRYMTRGDKAARPFFSISYSGARIMGKAWDVELQAAEETQAKARGAAEQDITIESGKTYDILTDEDLILTLKLSEGDILITSITLIVPKDSDPNDINGDGDVNAVDLVKAIAAGKTQAEIDAIVNVIMGK